MKVVVVGLSGDLNEGCRRLAEHFPAAFIETASREELQTGSLLSRLAALRARIPEVFALVTERLAWQRGQEALLLFGTLAGARRTIILDEFGGWREETRARILMRSPVRLLSEINVSRNVMRRAARELTRLEAGVAGSTIYSRHLGNHRAPKIVYLRATPGPGTQIGGAASHINGFINAATQLGASISLVSNDEIAGLNAANSITIIRPESVGLSRAAFDIRNNLLFTAAATAEIKRQVPDFIYQRYSRFSWAGVDASLQTGLPLFLEYNGSEVWVGRHWDRVNMLDLLERYERLNLSAAARIFVVSEVERRNLEQAAVDPDKIVVNPNGVDTDVFRPGVGGEQERKRFGVDTNETLIGFIGSFGPWHGVEVLAHAIRQIPAAARIRVLLVGSGSLLDQIKKLLASEEQNGRVVFTGSVKHSQVPALLDACDILVSPHVPLAANAEFFGSPTKIFEYMAMGKGIVASRLGQIGEVLSNEETALLVEPGNVEELTKALVRLAESESLRERLGQAARRAAIEHHTWKRNAETVLDAYAQWLREPKH